MRMHRQNGVPGLPAGREDNAPAPERRLGWRTRRRRDRENPRRAPGTGPAGGQAPPVPPASPASPAWSGPPVPPASPAWSGPPVPPASPAWSGPPAWSDPPAWLASPAPAAPDDIVADAIQLAVAFLTAGLDSPELEAWAADELTPPGPEGLGDLLAGLNVVSVLLLYELHEATEEPPPAILQRLALLAEGRRGKASGG
jgi:hypothetical protein